MTASTTPTSHANEAELLPLLARLVVSPEHQDNPRRAPLEKLLEHCEGQRERLERLVRISDATTRSAATNRSPSRSNTTSSCAAWKNSPEFLTATRTACAS